VIASACLLCGGLDHVPVFNEGGVDILRCRACRHVFSAFEADPHYDGFWGDQVADDEHVYWRAARRRMHRDFCARFIEGRSGRLLDLGCGLGFFLKALEPHRAWAVHGCEISPAAVRFARESLGLENVACGRLEEAPFPAGTFDIVTMWDVLDHLLRPDPVLSHCHALLKKGGLCFIRTPNVFVQLARARVKRLLFGAKPGVGYLQPHHHAHHYSAESIRDLLIRNGFSRVEFAHLHPIEDASGLFGRGLRRLAFRAIRDVAVVSRGALNFDNLFVAAYK
jgi:2-polyprenyl-3-methyl-5-hydroxy-6-metoxy-1,4-benzoquinol methylase